MTLRQGERTPGRSAVYEKENIMRKNSVKLTRINQEIVRELSEIIRSEVKDPRVGMMTSVTGWAKIIKTSVNIRRTPGGTSLTPKDQDKLPLGLVLRYTDRPGVIATIGQILSTAGINIENIVAPRDPISGDSLAFVKTNIQVSEQQVITLSRAIAAKLAFSLSM